MSTTPIRSSTTPLRAPVSPAEVGTGSTSPLTLTRVATARIAGPAA